MAVGKRNVKDLFSAITDFVKHKTINLNIVQSFLMKYIKKENRKALFGNLSSKLVRSGIVEPFDAGTYQGVTLYGVGTGKTNCPNKAGNYTTYLDVINGVIPPLNTPLCWGLRIPVTFGTDTWPVGTAPSGGGGVNHEMEHAIKCVTQCILNQLAQNNTCKPHIATHIVLFQVLVEMKIISDDDSGKKTVKQICSMMRKQQVIAGFTLIKCV